MWAHAVVVTPPSLDQDLSLSQAVEDLAVEQFVAQLAVEALAVAVLPRTAGRDWPDPLEVIHPLCWSEDHFGWMERWQGSATSLKRSSPSCVRLMS
jgi:hypothetical protein